MLQTSEKREFQTFPRRYTNKMKNYLNIIQYTTIDGGKKYLKIITGNGDGDTQT